MKTFLLRRAVGACCLTILGACADSDEAPDPAVPSLVTFTQAGLYPEGVAYNAADRTFFVGSQGYGTLGKVDLQGKYTPFAEDTALISTFGTLVDPSRNRLVTCYSDPLGFGARSRPATFRKRAGIAIYDLATGRQLQKVDLGALSPYPANANDVAVDAEGNLYVTNSFTSFIYKVNLAGQASVWLQDARLLPAPGKFGLNGIVFHPAGYLLATRSSDGAIFKIPVANPQAFTQVGVAGATIFASDGLVLRPDGRLVVITNAEAGPAGFTVSAAIHQLRSNDHWATATVEQTVSTGTDISTTGTLVNGQVYALYGQFDRLFAGQQPPATQFFLRKADLL